MAILKLGGFATQISGKIGGSIFGTSNNGSYMKSNAYSQQPNTPKQSIQRTKVNQANKFWRAVTPGDKLLWQTETANYPYTNRVGDIAYYNGYQLFNWLNINRLNTGNTINTAPPVFVALTEPIYTINSNTTAFMVLGWTVNAGTQNVTIYATRQMEPGAPTVSKDFLTIGNFNMLGANGTATIYALYTSVYGAPIAGKQISFKFKTTVVSSGNANKPTNLISSITV